MGTPNALSNLQFIDAVRPRSIPAVQQRRNKLSNKLWEQIQLARSQIEHTHFVVKRRVTVKDLEGNYKSIERPKRIKPWWFTDANGKVCVAIRYGAKVIELAKGKSAIEVASPAALIEALETVNAAVLAGELDAQLEGASLKLREGFTK